MNIISKTSKVNRQRSKILLTISGLTAVLLTGGFAVKGANAQWQWHHSNDLVYTQSNIPTPNGNSILGFRRDAFGTLTPLPTASFPTGGAGNVNAFVANISGIPINTTFASDNEVIANPEGTRLFAVNSGSNTIAVFDIKKDGSLSPVKGSPFPSGGVGPVSLGLANNFLYVLNWNRDPQNPTQEPSNSLPNYTGFRVTPQGKLIPIQNSTISIPQGSLPFQVATSPDKRLLFGVESGSKFLRSFQILPNGQLRPSPNSPQLVPQPAPPSPPNIPLGIGVHPKQAILYATFPVTSQLGVYSYDKTTGELTFLRGVSNSGIAICWITTNREGTRLYTSNTGSNSISVYDIAQDPTTPVEIQTVTLRGQSLNGPVQVSLDSTGSFLHVVAQPLTTNPLPNNQLHVLRVKQSDGTLTEVPTSPRLIPSVNNSFPKGIVAN